MSSSSSTDLPSTPPLVRHSSSPGSSSSAFPSTSRLVPRPKLPSPSHSTSSTPSPSSPPRASTSSAPITTRSFGPPVLKKSSPNGSGRNGGIRPRPRGGLGGTGGTASFTSPLRHSASSPSNDDRPPVASPPMNRSKTSIPSSPSLNSFLDPSDAVRRPSPGPSHRASSSAPFNPPPLSSTLPSAPIAPPLALPSTTTNNLIPTPSNASPLPSPSVFGGSLTGTRRSSFLNNFINGGIATAMNGRARSSSNASSASGTTTPKVVGPSEATAVDDSATTAGSSAANTTGVRTLYKAGFQPKGVWRVRTGEYEELRMKREEGRRGEERRLGRRLEKLIDLHFAPTPPPAVAPAPPPIPSSSSFSLDSLKNPGELWKGLKETSIGGSSKAADAKRIAEQAIVRWEEDSTVKKCPICTSSFNIANRKHHCRLCGRVVCALPPTPPPLIPSTPKPRKESCTLLVVGDYKLGRCEEVEEGFVGWLKVDTKDAGGGGQRRKGTEKEPMVNGDGAEKEGGKGSEEIKIQGVRICRTCWAVVSRKQYMLDAARVPAFSRLYESLRSLQQDIEDTLPEFQELLMNLQAASPSFDFSPAPTETEIAAHQLRKTLLSSLAAHDALAKRIRGLPAEKGSAQARLQMGIAVGAGTFMQGVLPMLQSLPKRKKPHRQESIFSGSDGGQSSSGVSQLQLDADLARALQPLLEQEHQLEGFIAEAEGGRKFDDAAVLKGNLEMIREEIERIARGRVC